MPIGYECINIHAYVNLCMLAINVPVSVRVFPEKDVKDIPNILYAACKYGVPANKQYAIRGMAIISWVIYASYILNKVEHDIENYQG